MITATFFMSDRQISLDLGNLNESLIKVWMTLDHVNNLSDRKGQKKSIL